MTHRPSSRLRPVAVVIVLTALVAAAGGFLAFRLQPTLAVVQPSRGPALEVVYATGTVEPETWAKVSPSVAGRVSHIQVREGEEVTQGQVLARLDDREAQARVAEVEARERYWRDELARQRQLAERGVVSREAQERTQSEYLQAQASSMAARQRLADFAVTSPQDGRVLRRDGEVGEVVERQDVLFWIGRPRPLQVTAEVDEEDIARVAADQRVLIKADAFRDQVFEGRVERITPAGDPVNKTFRVRVALPDDAPLLVGMTVEINIVTRSEEDALLLPASAVTDGHVLVVENGIAQPRPVTLGISGRTHVQIIDGLAGNEAVLLDPPEGIAGARVRARPANGASPPEG